MKNKGLSLVEVMIATAILGIVALMVIGLQLHMSSNTVRIREKMFATEKAMQMMEELRSLVLGSERTNIEVLDDYTENLSSGSANYVLTTDRSVTDPAHPNSGNMSIGGVWKYFRQVTVAPLPEEAHARKVEVKVYENSRTSPGTATKVLAETTSILRTIANEFVPTQVMDIYLIAIENVPGWWSDLATMVPTFDMVLQDIQMRNQGLEIRPHWIIRSAFGRDPFYMPYINSTTPTNAAAIPQVYFYPGMSSENNTVGGPAQLFYDPSRIRGNINVQGTLVSGGYPLADKYNHAVRYPDEEAMYAQYVIDESTAGRPVPEYSLRMLLERMNSNPNEFENALIVNLHGELIPFVPMRNYSDAAKSPANYPDLRIVSHPERLSYTSTDTVKVRVYPYAMVENATYPYGFVGRYYNANNYTNLLFTRSDSSINFDWAGGKPANNITNADAFSAIWRGRIRAKTTDNYTFTLRANGGGYFDFEVNGNDITLAADNNTLKIQTYAANLVQNTEYPIELGFTESFAGDASVQLTWQITGQPATEEVITFPDISTATVLFPGITINTSDITVQKFVGGSTVAYQLNTVADLVSGPDCRVAYPSGGTLLTFYNNPVLHPYSNPSGTAGGIDRNTTDSLLYGLEYIPCPVRGNDFSVNLLSGNNTKNTARWIISIDPGIINGRQTIETRIGTDLNSGVTTDLTNLSKTYVWVSTPVPFTEQYQYTGDPRHCPYTDVKQSGGYNWYFRQVADNALRYAGFANTANGYAHTANGAKVCDVDVPRTFLTFREGLLKNTAIWSAINGWSYYYFGLGGEFGADQTPFTNSIYFVETPWVAASAAINNVNEICNWNAPNIVYNRLVSKTDNSWYARFWLGELYPDGFFNIWTGSGNLPTGAGNFYRQNYNGIADLNFQRESSIGEEGCASFYNNGSDTSHFMHVGIGGPNTNGVIQAPGNRIMDTFGIPLLSPVSSVRPFLINSGSPDPVEINNAVYSGANKTALTVMQQFYNDTASGSRNTAAMVRMVKGTDTCYTSVAGFETTANFGTSQIGRFALASVMQTFLEGGLNTGQDHIPQIPYVDLTSPGVSTTLIDPINIGIQWNLSWNKWDGQKYTALYPNGYTETTPVVYILKYSNDGGSKWRYCTDGTAAQAGKRSATHETTSTSYTWPASGLSRGTYIIRVECFRTNINQHYSYDQVSVYIQK